MRLVIGLVIAIGLVNLLARNSQAASDGRLTSVKLEDLTPPESSLKFKAQKIGWKFDKVRFWGVVTNSGGEGFQFVSVSFTALGPNGEFLGREKTYVDPSELKGGDSGDINDFSLDTEGKIPAIIQFKVTGKSQ
jgi:hypothetical protein